MSSAVKVLKKLDVKNISIVGVAKGLDGMLGENIYINPGKRLWALVNEILYDILFKE